VDKRKTQLEQILREWLCHIKKRQVQGFEELGADKGLLCNTKTSGLVISS
jgi:hypothetical protein